MCKTYMRASNYTVYIYRLVIVDDIYSEFRLAFVLKCYADFILHEPPRSNYYHFLNALPRENMSEEYEIFFKLSC